MKANSLADVEHKSFLKQFNKYEVDLSSPNHWDE